MNLNTALDTYARQDKSGANTAGAEDLMLRTGGNATAYAYVRQPGIPTGPDVTIHSATWLFYVRQAWAGNTTLKMRTCTSDVPITSITWKKQPATTAAGELSKVVATPAAGAEIAFDVKDFVAAIAAGQPNYGIRLEANVNAVRSLHSADAKGDNARYRPMLVIAWSAKPGVPTALNPSAGLQVSILRPTLTSVYGAQGDNPMAQQRVQFNPTNDWNAPAVDTGYVPAQVPQIQLPFDADEWNEIWYRWEHVATDGSKSGFSTPVMFGHTPKGALDLLNPAAAPNDFVTELTPPVLWDADFNQTQFRVRRFLPGSSIPLDDSNVQPGDGDAWTLEKPYTFDDAGKARVEVAALDDVPRATTPGDDPWVRVSRDFSFEPGNPAGGAVTGLTASAEPFGSAARLTFQRGTAPDSFTIFRKLHSEPDTAWRAIAADVLPGDLLQTGTTYAFVDHKARPRLRYDYGVADVTNGVARAAFPTDDLTIETEYVWLTDPADPAWWVAFAGTDSGSWDMGEQSTLFETRGGDELILVSEARRGYENAFTGELHSDLPGLDGATAVELRDRLWHLKRYPTRVYRFVLGSLNIPVTVRKVVPREEADEDLWFTVTFEYNQAGELPWREDL